MGRESLEELLLHLVQSGCCFRLERKNNGPGGYKLTAVRQDQGRLDLVPVLVLDVRAGTLDGLILAADAELNGKDNDA